MNILVIAPHPDDESIGCGGTICRHVDSGDRVTGVFLTSGELGLKHLPREKARAVREREARRAVGILGLAETWFLRGPDWMLIDDIRPPAKELRAILEREPPGVVYLPHDDEWHPDHKAAGAILRSALRASGIVTPQLRAYEVWTPLAQFDQVQDITPFMPRKLRALRAHRSQLKEFDYVRAVRGLNAFRGALAAKCDYAEVFQTLEWGRRK